MKNNYLIESDDFVVIDSLIKKIIKDNGFDNEVVNYYDLEENELSSVLEDLDTYSFLSPRKVIVLKNTFFLESSSKLKVVDEDVEHLIKYLNKPSDDVLFIMCTSKLDSRKKLTKDIKKLVNFVNSKITVNDVLREQFKDYKIDFKARNLLIQYTNENISMLTSECLKLKLFKYDEKVITEEDVEKICFKAKKDTDKMLFEFVNFIASRNKKKAFELYLELLDYDYTPIDVIGRLASQLRLIYQIMLSYDDNISNNDLATILGVHPYRLEKSLPLVYNFSKGEIVSIIEKLGKLDLDIKSGKKDAKLAFKMFLINL